MKKKQEKVEAKPDWDGPSQNPEFKGATPRDIARALLRPVDRQQTSKKAS